MGETPLPLLCCGDNGRRFPVPGELFNCMLEFQRRIFSITVPRSHQNPDGRAAPCVPGGRAVIVLLQARCHVGRDSAVVRTVAALEQIYAVGCV